MKERAYVYEINAHAIGDTLGNMSWDIQAERRSIPLFWHVHYGLSRGGEVNHYMSDGWLNVELFRLFDRASLFRNRIHIPLIYSANRGEPQCRATMARYVEWVYGREVEIEDLGCHPDFRQLFPRVVPMPDEFRRRFAFLARGGSPNRYATIQPTSARHTHEDQLTAGRTKRISVGAALKHLRTLPERGINRLVVVGCRKSRDINARFVARITPELPSVEIIDTTGTGTLEDYFARLYGSVFHVACESGSSFFTSQIDIESVLTFRPVSVQALEIFTDYFRDVPSLTIEYDEQDCLDGDTSDLEARCSMKDELIERGFVKLPGLISAVEATAGLEEVKSFVAKQDVPLSTVSAFGCMRFAHERIESALKAMGFADPYSLGPTLVNKLPREQRRPWHDDWRWWQLPEAGRPEPVQLGIIIYLRDSVPTNGCLRVIPGSHLKYVPDIHSRENPLATHPDEVDVPAKAGDAVIIDARLLHATHENSTDENREAINFWYRVDPAFDHEQPMRCYAREHFVPGWQGQ